MATLAEDLTKNNRNQSKSGGVWGGVAPPARAGENIPKKAKKLKKSSKNLRKSSPDPPKIDPKTVINELLKEHRINNAQGEAT